MFWAIQKNYYQPIADKELDTLVMLKSVKSNFEVSITAEFPERLHFRNSGVLQRLILVAKEGYAFSHDFAPKMKLLDALGNRTESLTNTYGCSGNILSTTLLVLKKIPNDPSPMPFLRA